MSAASIALITLTFVSLLLFFAQTVWAVAPKNTVFNIGDGMASTHHRMAEEIHQRKLAMNTLQADPVPKNSPGSMTTPISAGK